MAGKRKRGNRQNTLLTPTMRPAQPHAPAPLPAFDSSRQFDYTKTRSFAAWEILFKAVTALGVVALGIAGMRIQMLQQKTADDRALLESQSKSETEKSKRHILTLHGLTQIEILLREAEFQFGRRSYTTNEGEVMKAYGRAITATADSLHYPDAPPISITPQKSYGYFQTTRASDSVDVPLVSGVTLAGEVLQLCGIKTVEIAEDKEGLYKTINDAIRLGESRTNLEQYLAIFDPKRCTIDYTLGQSTFGHVPVDERSCVAWQVWYPTNGTWVHFMNAAPVALLCENVRLQIEGRISKILQNNPTLIKDYLEERKYLEAKKSLFLPINRELQNSIQSHPKEL
jgi:hypothetical protein